MALGYAKHDLSDKFNSVYNITEDLSGWSESTIQVVPPFGGTIAVQATNDSGAVLGVTQGNAQLAINFMPALVTNLQTGATTNYIYGAGLYKYDVNAQFLRLQGQPASSGTSVYKLLLFNSKID